MRIANIIKQYLNQDKNLTLLNGRKPILDDWTSEVVTEDKLYSHKGNIGWVIGKGDLVVDIDPRNGGDEAFIKLKELLNVELEPTVMTPRGGFHIYLKMPRGFENHRFKKQLKEFKGIDFLTQGAQCVIPGSTVEQGDYVWADDLFGEFEQTLAPKNLIDLIAYEISNDDGLGDFEGLVGGGSNWPEAKVLKMMDRLDPSMPNDEWVKVGMALHDWDPLAGLEIWEEWSQAGENYDEGETEKRWRSFDLGGGVTLGTISYMVKEVVYDDEASLVRDYISKIKFADEKSLEFDLAPKLRKLEISGLNREKIVKAIQDRYKEISGIRMPVSSVRQMVGNAEIVNGQFIEDGKKPEWCNQWVYVNSHGGFVDLKTLHLHKAESFNVENGQNVPFSDTGSKPSASKYVADYGFVEKVDSIAYLPTYEGVICQIEGATVLNSFNPKTVPIEAQEYSEEGLAAIERVKAHIKFICDTEENTSIFTQWLAHQVQFPGRQILWSPVIQSIQGIGKSFFGELLRACIGDRNVGVVSPSQAVSDFNPWATGVVVNVLEELRVVGNSRFDVVNALKPLITDRIIMINDKGVRQYQTYNTANYICFTNYRDAIPLDEDDRRWWVLFAVIESLKDLKKFVGEDASTYFPALFDAVRSHPQELRKWFLEYKITPEFLKIKQAPMTDSKRSMIATEEASFDGLSEVRELLNEGGQYFNKECISSADLFEHLLFENPELEINTSRRNIILKRLGYSLEPSKVKIDGKARRIWTKRRMSNDEIRDCFQKLVPSSELI